MDLSIIGKGNNSGVKLQVDPTHGAARMSVRPIEIGSVGGSYALAGVSGTMAAGLAAGSPILAFRNPSSSLLMLIRRIRISAGTLATAFAEGGVLFDIIRAQAFTVQDTGGAAVAFTAAKSNVLATRQQPTLADIRMSATATLTAGTRVLDTNPFGAVLGHVGAVPSSLLCPPNSELFAAIAGGQPLELQANEGFVIRATVPITGTWQFGINMDWDEIDPTIWQGG